MASAFVVAGFGYGHVVAIVGDEPPDDRVHLAAWGLVVLAAAVYAARARSVARLTGALNGLAAILVVMVLATILPFEASRAAPRDPAPAAAVEPATVPDHPRDIYFLVFDRYGSADSIERRFGLTDNDMYEWLASRGFQVPADSRAAYRATDFSLASTLNLRYLDELTVQFGRESSDRTPARRLIEGHEVGRFLASRGYTTYHLGSWFGPTASGPNADVNLAPGVTSEFEQVLRDTTVLPAIDRVLGNEPPESTFRDRHRESGLFQLRQLHRIATAPGPKFVFAHVLLPHDPYVLDADGNPIGEAEADAGDERDLYADHVAFVNREIRSLVDELLSGPETSRPIVIIQADEGPLLCRSVDCPEVTPEYVAIRFGILNAMYLPGAVEPLPSTFTAVNTFRTVFREYFGANLENLPDHSYTWPDNDHIFDFIDVTAMLDGRVVP